MARLIGLDAPAEMHETKQRLLEAGLRLLLERGYHAIGVQEILTETGIPKGSFYHHFESKEDFALQAVDVYHTNAYELLDRIIALSSESQWVGSSSVPYLAVDGVAAARR